jgi:hypothetical protein
VYELFQKVCLFVFHEVLFNLFSDFLLFFLVYLTVAIPCLSNCSRSLFNGAHMNQSMWKTMTKADVQIERNSDVKTNFIPAKRGVSPGEFSGRAAGLIACRRRSISLPAFVFRKD